MEEKILNNQATLSFDLQRFAVALTDGVYEHIGTGDDAKTITCYFTGITGIGNKTFSTTNINNKITVSGSNLNVGDKTFTLSTTNGGAIYFTGTATVEGDKISSIDSITAVKVSGVSLTKVTNAYGIKFTLEQENDSIPIDGLTYTAKDSSVNVTVNAEDSKVVTLNGSAVDISGTSKGYTFNVSNNLTTTINGFDFKSKGGTKIQFGSTNNSTVTLTGSFRVGDGTKKLKHNINGVAYSGTGIVDIASTNITLLGNVTVEDDLNNKSYITSDTSSSSADRDATFTLSDSDTTTIDNITYSAKALNSNKVQVTNENITLSGTLTVGTGFQDLSKKIYVVQSGASTFKTSGSVTVNDVKYTSTSSGGTVEVEFGVNDKVTFTGNFDVDIKTGKSITANDVVIEAI